MTRTECFGTPIELLPPDVVEYIDHYTPRSLSQPRWQAYRTAVCTLTAATLPVSAIDAKTVLSVQCRLIAWAEVPMATPALSELLQPNVIKRFLGAQAGTHEPGSRGNDAGRLQRCVNVLNGEPARTERQEKSPTTPPYAEEELATLETVAAGSPVLAAILEAGLTRGLVIPAAYGHEFPVLGSLTENHWLAARKAAAAAGVPLTAERLRRTYVHRRCRTGRVSDLRDLSRADLDGVRWHLDETDSETTRILLRCAS